jgi:hypothetical protein
LPSKPSSADDFKTRFNRAFSKAGKKVQDAGQKIGRSLQESGLDKDAEEMITYLNEEVIPAVRSHSTRALRTAARKLAAFADYMDDERQR